MKKLRLVIICISLVLGFFKLKEYYIDTNNSILKKENKVKHHWYEIQKISKNRVLEIQKIHYKYDCNKDNIKLLDSILLYKSDYKKSMDKNFHNIENKANIILNSLYECSNIKDSEIEQIMKPYNDSLYIEVKNYNKIVEDYNKDIFDIVKSIFINDKYESKRYLQIDYSNNLEKEITKQKDIEHWIKTGEMPKEKH